MANVLSGLEQDGIHNLCINGAYKESTTGTSASATVITRDTSSGDAFASGDVGRFLSWDVDTAESNTFQVRYITAVDVGNQTITVEDGFSSTPPSGARIRISNNMDDLTVGVTATFAGGSQSSRVYVTKHGDNMYVFTGDLRLDNKAFVADVDKAIYITAKRQTMLDMQHNQGCIMQFGRLRGGEGTPASQPKSIETIGGCYINLRSVRSDQGNVFEGGDNETNLGAVVNWYGCQIESSTTTTSNFRFMRMRGPVRFIGCIFDGRVGGRFYSPYSEWVDCRHSGVNHITPAWSLGATFVRDIENIKFYQSVCAVKNFSTFGGNLRNTTFNSASLTDVFNLNGNSSSTVNLIDCTTLVNADVDDNGAGTINQIKSVNYSFANSAGVGVDSARLAIYDSDGLRQGSIVESVAASAGAVPEVLPVFTKLVDTASFVDKGPFTVRIRKYGNIYQDFTSGILSPIRQEYRLPPNTVTALTKAQALAVSGVAVDFTGKTLTISAALTLNQIYDFTQIHMQLDAQMPEPEFFKTTDGVTFTLDPNWKLVLNSGGDITSATGKTLVVSGTGVVQLNHAGNNIDNLTITGNALLAAVITGDMTNVTVSGDLTFAAVGTYNLVNSTIGVVKNSSGGNVALNSTNTTITTNTGPNITITTLNSLTLTGLLANTEVRIYTAGTTTEIGGVENSGTSFTLAGITVSAVDIQIHALAHLNQRLTSIATTSDSTIPITQIIDRQYENPS